MNRSYWVAMLAALPFCTYAVAATAPQYALIDLGETDYTGQGMIWATRAIEDVNGWPTPAPCTLGNHSFQSTPVLMSGQSFISLGSACTKNGSHAVKWTNTENVPGTILTDIGVLPGALVDNSDAIGANEVGDVVGESATAYIDTAGHPAIHAFLWNSGKITDLGSISGPNYTSKAVAVNDSHEVIGVSEAVATATGALLQRAFVYTNGKMYNLTFYTTSGPTALLEDALWIDCQGNIAAVGRPASQPGIRHSYLLVRQGPPRTCRQF
jgi:probable HAF family extracellular repeat protein